MKKLIYSIFAILLAFSVNAQYTIMSAVDLKDGAEQDYLELEKFWSPLHEKAIEEGIQNFQAVFKIIQSNDESDVAADYVILTGFSSKEQLDTYNASVIETFRDLAYDVYKGKMSRRAINSMFSGESLDNGRRNYHLVGVDGTIWAGGQLKVGDRMNITTTMAKSEDFVDLETKYVKPIMEQLILKGQHRWWGLSEIYETSENAYDGISHMFFNLPVEGATEGLWSESQKTFTGQKMIQLVGAASSHQTMGSMEVVYVHTQ